MMLAVATDSLECLLLTNDVFVVGEWGGIENTV